MRPDYLPNPLRAWYEARQRRVDFAEKLRDPKSSPLIRHIDQRALERARADEAAAWEALDRSPVDHYDIGGGWAVERRP